MTKFNTQIHMAIVDYEKACDSIINEFTNARIDYRSVGTYWEKFV